MCAQVPPAVEQEVRSTLSINTISQLTGKCSGVPYVAVIVVMLLGCLAYLALNSGTAQVITWILKSVFRSGPMLLSCANTNFVSFCTAATMLYVWLLPILLLVS